MHIIKTTVPIPTKLCTAIKTTNALGGWSKDAHNKSKIAGGRHLEKLKNRHISATV